MSDKITLTVKEFKAWCDKSTPVKLIDVREEWERAIACLKDDIHIPLDQFQQNIPDHNKDETFVIYCHHGRRSLAAVLLMREAGFTQVYNLEGGVDAWSNEIDQNMAKY